MTVSGYHEEPSSRRTAWRSRARGGPGVFLLYDQVMKPIPLPPEILAVAEAITAAGGRALLVGGTVRDWLFAELDPGGTGDTLAADDYDVEVYGLELSRLEEVLASFGEVISVGRSFGVFMIKGLFPGDGPACSFSLPRRDNKVGRGHRGFQVELDPGLDFEEAARRRDLTMNSMGIEIPGGQLEDPHGGQADIEAGIMRATDPVHFSEDPLRGLRVAQFASRFPGLKPDRELVELCAALELSELPGERLLEEFKKLLLKGERPSLGLDFLLSSGLLRFFPELESMVGVPQDAQWHPEGTVWEHTLMVVDEAAAARSGSGSEEEDLIVMFAALCHDLGKPATTVEIEGRVRSPNHEREGIEPTRSFLGRLMAPSALVVAVEVLVQDHLAPANFTSQNASPRAYRRLARRLDAGAMNAKILFRLAEADHFGRGTPDALAREFPAGEEFLRQVGLLELEDAGEPDVVLGRHLIERGLEPGPGFGEVLERCRELQDETGWKDPGQILERYFSENPA